MLTPSPSRSAQVLSSFPPSSAASTRATCGWCEPRRFRPIRPNGPPPRRPVAAGRQATLDLLDGVPGLYYVTVTSRSGGQVTTTASQQSLEIRSFDGYDQIRRELHAGDTLTLTLRGSGFTPGTVFTLGGRAATLSTVLDPVSPRSSPSPTSRRASHCALAAVGRRSSAVAPGSSLPRALDARRRGRLAGELDRAGRHAAVQPALPRDPRHDPVPQRQRGQPARARALGDDRQRSLRLASDTLYVGAQLGLLGVKSTGRARPVRAWRVGFDRSDAVASDQWRRRGVERQRLDPARTQARRRRQWVPAAPPACSRSRCLPNAFDEIRPPTVSELAWRTVVKPNLLSLVGTTTESYASTLRNVAARFAAGWQ